MALQTYDRHHCDLASGNEQCCGPESGERLQVNTHNLERVRKVKTRHQRLHMRVTTVREDIESFLQDDDDMMKLCLTRKKELEQIQQQREQLQQQQQQRAEGVLSCITSPPSEMGVCVCLVGGVGGGEKEEGHW